METRNVCTGLLHRFLKRHQRWANGFRQDPTEGPLQELQGVLAESVCPCHWKNNFALHLQIHTTAMVRNTCLCCTDLILFETYQKHLQSPCSLAFLGFQNLQHNVDCHTGLLHTCESHARRSSPKCTLISESSVVSLELETEVTKRTAREAGHQCCHEQACHGSRAVEKLRETEGAENRGKPASRNNEFILIALSNVMSLSTTQRNLSPPVPVGYPCVRSMASSSASMAWSGKSKPRS